MDTPFDEGGVFAKNIRAEIPDDDTELRESLKAYGWNPEFPALADENGVILVGHRRIRIAGKLGIEPVIKTLRFGKGDEADAERIKLALVSNIGAKPLTAKDRQHIAQHLYGEKEWTMQRIAKALNVSQKTISKDLSGVYTQGINPSRPKGGRPKGSGKTSAASKSRSVKARHTSDAARRAAELVLDKGKTHEQAAKEVGLGSELMGRMAVAHEIGRREGRADPVIDPATLSLSAQEKLAAAARQQTERLERSFQIRLEEGISKWVDETGIKLFVEQYNTLRRDVTRRDGIMPLATYKLIERCLHPDNSASARMRDQAFIAFQKVKVRLCDDKELPMNLPPMPATRAEWEARRQKRQAELRAKKNGGEMARR